MPRWTTDQNGPSSEWVIMWNVRSVPCEAVDGVGRRRVGGRGVGGRRVGSGGVGRGRVGRGRLGTGVGCAAGVLG